MLCSARPEEERGRRARPCGRGGAREAAAAAAGAGAGASGDEAGALALHARSALLSPAAHNSW